MEPYKVNFRGWTDRYLAAAGSGTGGAKLRASPLIIRMSNGNIMQSPYQRIVNQQTNILRGFIAELGFSPAARTSIALEPDDEPDPTDRYFE